MDWNFGDLLDGIDRVLPPDATALVHGDERISWRDFSRRSNALARALIERGARPDDKVAIYMRNAPEYLIALAACFKARLVQVNVNYRYKDSELHYILENSDARYVVFGAEFGDVCDRIRGDLPGVELWIEARGDAASFAVPMATLEGENDGRPLGIPRSGKDLLFLYTGGTTGMPKGVMWQQEDLWAAMGSGVTIPANRKTVPPDPASHVANVERHGPGPRQIVACPLMHGTGLFMICVTLLAGGMVETLPGEKFDAGALLDAVERDRIQSLVIVGDAFARPILNALDANPGRWDLSSLRVVLSSGVIWSQGVKEGLLRHHPGMRLADMFGSSEAIGFGTSVTSAESGTKTAKFQLGESCRVFTEDHREVLPGSDEIGFVARSGAIPLGYYKDPEKTAQTFPTIDGIRYSVPGDWCHVEKDGTLTLLGRGSNCINTAGEKVYPEEVEEALKTHPSVEDALVVGVPDETWGSAVTAVVELRPGETFDDEALRAHVRERLAGYKSPKFVLSVERMFRAPNGKADYKSAETFARSELGRAD